MAKSPISTVPVIASAIGNSALVAAANNQTVAVLAYSLSCNTAVTIQFQSNNTNLTGPMSAINGVPLVSPACPVSHAADFVPLFATNAGESLNMNLGANAAVAGYVVVQKFLSS